MLHNKVALVTGATGGIGKSIISRFQKEGIVVVGIARNQRGDKNILICDVRNETEVKAAVNTVLERYKKIDIMVNNVATIRHRTIEQETLEDFNDVISTNLTSYFLFSKYCIPIMQKRKAGKIINISSIAGRSNSPKASSAYVCSKYAIIGLTKQLAHLYARFNIQINCICPGQTRTPMLMKNLRAVEYRELKKRIPAGRVGEPEEIANLVYFLSRDEVNYMNGAVIDVNGGQL